MIRWLSRRPRWMLVTLALCLFLVVVVLLYPAARMRDQADGALQSSSQRAAGGGVGGRSTDGGDPYPAQASLAATFVTQYLSYSYQSPGGNPAQLKDETTQRLYQSLASGQDPSGMKVPWLAASPTDDEVDTATVTKTLVQRTTVPLAQTVRQDPLTATVTATLAIKTSQGSAQVVKEMSLALVDLQGTWLVDWVQQTGTQTRAG